METEQGWRPPSEVDVWNEVEILLVDGKIRRARWVVAKRMWLVGPFLVPPDAVEAWRPLRLASAPQSPR